MNALKPQFTEISVRHEPQAALAKYVGSWFVEYKRDGLKKVQGFWSAISAAQFGSKLEAGELDDDVLAGDRTAPTKVGATRGPWRASDKPSLHGPGYVDIDGGIGLVHGWMGLASVAVKTEGTPSEQGAANLRLILAAPAMRDALRALCDAALKVETDTNRDLFTDAFECRHEVRDAKDALGVLLSASEAAIALMVSLGVAE